MKGSLLLEIGVVVLIIFVLLKSPPGGESINPSDIICSTYGQCSVGDEIFSIGDMVSSPKYNFGFTIGEIILINQDELTATVKWNNGRTTTDLLTELNKVKEI